MKMLTLILGLLPFLCFAQDSKEQNLCPVDFTAGEFKRKLIIELNPEPAKGEKGTYERCAVRQGGSLVARNTFLGLRWATEKSGENHWRLNMILVTKDRPTLINGENLPGIVSSSFKTEVVSESVNSIALIISVSDSGAKVITQKRTL